MECFAHSNSNAVGVCKSCGKGVCRACAISVTRGLACSTECKPIAESLSKAQLVSIRNIGLASAQRTMQPFFAVLLLGLGLFLLARGSSDAFTWFFIATGGGLGLVMLASWRKRGS